MNCSGVSDAPTFAGRVAFGAFAESTAGAAGEAAPGAGRRFGERAAGLRREARFGAEISASPRDPDAEAAASGTGRGPGSDAAAVAAASASSVRSRAASDADETEGSLASGFREALPAALCEAPLGFRADGREAGSVRSPSPVRTSSVDAPTESASAPFEVRPPREERARRGFAAFALSDAAFSRSRPCPAAGSLSVAGASSERSLSATAAKASSERPPDAPSAPAPSPGIPDAASEADPLSEAVA